MDDHTYLMALERVVPALSKADPERAFDQLLSALRKVTDREGAHHRELVVSGVWRSSIDGSNDSLDARDLDAALIDRVLDLGGNIAANHPERLPHLVTNLRADPVGRRIATLLIAQGEHPQETMVAQALLDAEQLHAWLGEYRLLITKHFQTLSRTSRRALITLIEAGPSKDEYESDTPQRVRIRRLWSYRRLKVVRQYLDARELQVLQELTSEFGEVEEADLDDETVLVGSVSPVTEDWLEARSPADVASYLREWTPSVGSPPESPEALARRLEAVVRKDARRYAAEARQFSGLQATYARALVSGIRGAVAAGEGIDWRPILEIAGEVVTSPRVLPDRFEGTDADLVAGQGDPDWSWGRREVAALVLAGVDHETSGLTVDLAPQLWGLVDVITEDPEPDPDHESRYGMQNMDWNTIALNTVRPNGFLALFGLWKWLSDKESVQEVLLRVREKASQHLDVSRDPSLAVRATFGRNVPMLLTVDPSWLDSNVAEIFPLDKTRKSYDWAAWAAYLAFWRPHPEAFALLRERYIRGIADVGTEPAWRWLRDPDEALGQHLVGLYASGWADYDEWLAPYFERASPDLRGSIMSWVGRTSGGDELDEGVRSRLMDLWARRLAAARVTPADSRGELAAFGWWFAHGRFDTWWSLQQLAEVLHLQSAIDDDHQVVDRLADLAAKYPEEASHDLMLLVSGLAQTWRLIAWSEGIEVILRAALASGSSDARDEARHIIGVLALRHGRSDFRGLLSAADGAAGPSSGAPR